MTDIKPIVDAYASDGAMTRAEYDGLVERVQADGEVDSAEQDQLVRIFKLVQEGNLEIVDTDRETLDLRLRSIRKQQMAEAVKKEAKEDTAAESRFKSRFGSDKTPTTSADGAYTRGQAKPPVEEPKPRVPPALDKKEVALEPDVEFEPSPALKPEVSDTKPEYPAQYSEPSYVDNTAGGSSRYSLQEFLLKAKNVDKGNEIFELEQERILEINLRNSIWIKSGSMIAFSGAVKLTREGILEHGVGKLLAKSITGEGTRLTKATGSGKLYVADRGKKVSIIELAGETISVNGNDLLAFEPSVQWDIVAMKKLAAMMAGGMFNVRLQGTGKIAITTYDDPLVLSLRSGETVVTDPQATVAWSGGLTPKFRTDVTAKTFVGRGSGDSVQMIFEGDGFVVVQPYEEEDSHGEKKV